jgi:hypothetical protein
MSGQPDETTQLVDAVSLELVGQFAPKELEIFDDLAQDFHDDPTPPEAKRGPESPLGFGLDAAMIATSPAVMAAVTACVAFVMNAAADALKDQTKGFIQEQVKKLFKGSQADPAKFNLTADQLKHVEELAAKEARRFGLKKAEADRLAAVLAGRLATHR